MGNDINPIRDESLVTNLSIPCRLERLELGTHFWITMARTKLRREHRRTLIFLFVNDFTI